MDRVVDFNQKTEDFKISVEKNEDGDNVVIITRSGRITIHLVNDVEEKNIFNKFIEFVKNKGQRRYQGTKIVEISENECKELICKYLRMTSWDNSISKSEAEEVWNDIKQDILNCIYFQIIAVFPGTFIMSEFFEVK